MVGDPVGGPALGRDGEGVLGGLLGAIEVAEEADQGRHHAAPLVAEDAVYHSLTGLISTPPPRRAAGMRAATAIAVSRSSASKTA